jgi:lipoprotein-anchoring transpeptidase ErfK/SrfK
MGRLIPSFVLATAWLAILFVAAIYGSSPGMLPDSEDEHTSALAVVLDTSAEAPHDPWILISVPDRTLAVILLGQSIGMYKIGVGKPSTPTPLGEFRITSLDPRPRSRSGSFGTRWMEFSRKTVHGITHVFGIHGTNLPDTIGSATSGGCVRLRNQDVEEVCRKAYVGQPVRIVDRPLDELGPW